MTSRAFELRGLDGANPLGFLAAVGTLVVAVRSGEVGARLRWTRDYRWLPVFEDVACPDEASLCGILAATLGERSVSPVDDEGLAQAQKAMDAAKRAVKKRQEDLRKRRLRGAELRQARERELRPLEAAYQRERENSIQARARAVPRPELALGKRIEDARREHYRELAERLLAGSDPANRDALDQLAALGTDACVGDRGQLQPTPFEFTSGSGHQFFLDDVRTLIGHVTLERIQATLFQPWSYRDARLSMRWDPVEDRRYALFERDPSAKRARTVWMANLLAYHALALFPTAPAPRRLLTTGWREEDARAFFTWPLWEYPADRNTVRSVLGLTELVLSQPDKAALRARGIGAVFRAERVIVGRGANRKINFSPAQAVC